MCGCASVKQMNDQIDRSNTLIYQNCEAVEKSTSMISANSEAIASSTALINKNKELMESIAALMPKLPIQLGLVLLGSCLFLPSLITALSLRRFTRKFDPLLKNK
jgi:hypothetical protein